MRSDAVRITAVGQFVRCPMRTAKSPGQRKRRLVTLRSPSVPRRLVRRVLSDRQRVALGRAAIALRARTHDLDALARLYGTDKSSEMHDYTSLYAHHLGPRRRQVRAVLEIGVGGVNSWDGYDTMAGGQSLRMWRDYFPNAMIVGVDVHDKQISGPRLVFECGDQSDAEFMRGVAEAYGPFDLVVDDGSHIGRHIAASFEALWTSVRPGGYYVIEDLACAYDPRWEGGPPGTPGTAVELVKRQIDDTVRREGETFDPSTAVLHVYSEIVFIGRTTMSTA